MKILLTGATGFLGKYVIDELKNNSYQVVAFGRNEKIGKTMVLVSHRKSTLSLADRIHEMDNGRLS